MEELGLLVGNEQSISVQLPMWDRDSTGRTLMTFYDSTNPQAQAYIWAKVRENYVKHGIRTWSLDACEPERQHQRPAVPRADRPLVPVRRLLPGLQAARDSRARHHDQLGAGGTWITAPAPLDTIPVYLRDSGTIEPFGPLAGFGGMT